jgi:uncharacterized oxidoreductase
MDLSSNTVLITGGSNGIGFALAQRFSNAGSEVIICGRRENKLNEAKEKIPGVKTRVCDVASADERESLFKWAVSEFPLLNVLVNNAGIQRRIPLTDKEDWKLKEEEININLDAPIHLSTLFIPHLTGQKDPAIINITSGLAFVPMSMASIYCATKAALHSFTLSLRHQLSKTPISVIEIIPPSVQTDLGGPGLHDSGTPLDEFADAVVSKMKHGDIEIAYGFSEGTSKASRQELDETFKRMNK